MCSVSSFALLKNQVNNPLSTTLMMATLASIALTLSASYSVICDAFQPASVSPFRQLSLRTIPLAKRSTTSSLSRLRRNLSESATNAALEEDTTFFTQASRQAARERYEMLLSGEDPFGLFGEVSTSFVDDASPDDVSSSAVDGRGAATDSPPVVLSESTSEPVVMSLDEYGSSDTIQPPKSAYDALQSSPPSPIHKNSPKGVSEISDSQYSDLLSTISASENGKNKLTGDASGRILDRYNFQRRLLEARFTMESNKTSSSRPSIKSEPPEEAEIKPKPSPVSAQRARKSFESKPKEVDVSSSQPVAPIAAEEQAGGPGCIRKVEEDSIVEKVTYRNRDELHRELFPKEQEEEEETMLPGLNNIDTSEVAKASSAVHQEATTTKEDHDMMEKGNPFDDGDGELAGLPSDASPSTHVIEKTELREENIAIGLLVMTRSLMALKQVFGSKGERGT